MKKIENWIEKKDSTNTFKKFKFKHYLNKSFLKKKSYFFLKFKIKGNLLKYFFKCFSSSIFLKKTFPNNFFKKKDKVFMYKQPFFKKNILKSLIIFLNKIIFIRNYKPLTPSLRFKKSLFLIKSNIFSKKFKLLLKNNSGRNNQGNITVFSKGFKKNTSTVPFLTLNKWDKKLSTTISIIKSKKKLYSLNKHSTGSISIKPYISGVCLGQKTFLSNLPKKFWNNNLPGSFVILKFLSRYSVFSNIFIKNIRKYSLSNGTFCQVLDFFNEYNLIKISLPSKKIKFVSGWNFVLLGRNSQLDHRYKCVGKAGANILLGKKPKVRGVARNPVDHPHGGRTKTNQPEVSIWGWIAKKNK